MLEGTGMRFAPVRGDGLDDRVAITAFGGDGTAIMAIGIGPLGCNTAEALNGWVRFGVDRAARKLLGSAVAAVEGETAPRFSDSDGAIRILAFTLADGRRVTAGRDWQGGDPATREFPRVMRRSACKRFASVLGPEAGEAGRG